MLRGFGRTAGLALVLAFAAVPAARAQPKPPAVPAARERVMDRLKAAQAALEASDFSAAMMHAEAAAEAARSLAESDESRVEATLRMSDIRAAKAFRAGDLAGARAEFNSAVTLGRGLPKGHPARVQTVLASAELLMALKETDAALARYEEVLAQLSGIKRIPRDRQARLVSALMSAFLRSDRRGEDPVVIRRLTDEARRALPKGAEADPDLRPIALKIWNILLGRAIATQTASHAESKSRAAQLREDLDRAGALLAQAGGSSALTAWSDLYLIRYLWPRGQLGAAREAMARLKPHAEAMARLKPHAEYAAPAQFRGEYWSYAGLLATAEGDYVAAREAHETELRIRRKEKLQGSHRTLNSLGRLLLRLGDYGAARLALEESVSLCANEPFLKNDEIRPIALTQLGQALEGTGGLNEAARLHREALAMAEKAISPDPQTIAMCHNNLGVNRYAAAEIAAAGREFEAARGIVAKAFGESSLSVAEIDANLGWVARAGGKAAEAEARFRHALLSITSESPDSRRRAEVLGYLASVLGELGRVDEARRAIDEALSLREASLRRALRSAFSERERLAIAQELRFHPESRAWPGVLDAYLDLAPTLKVEPEAQYAHVLVWKGAVGRGSLAGAAGLEDDPEVSRLVAEREGMLRKLRAEAAETPSREERAQHEERLAEIEKRVDELERKLRSRSRRYADVVGGDDPAPAAVLAAVRKGWVLVDVIEARRPGVVARPGKPLREDRRYVAFIARAGRPIARLDLGDADPIDTALRDFLRVMDAPTDRYVEPARRLATLIRDPLRPHLDGAEGLILAGDGLLHRLPMAALPGTVPGTFWVEEIAFATVPAAQSLIGRAGDRPKASGALIVGDVDYKSFAGLPDLPKTKEEAESIAGQYRAKHPGEAVDHLTRGGATEPAVRSRIRSRKLVHLATHGFFPDEAKAVSSSETFGALAQLDSGIVLARAKPGSAVDTDDDQTLTAGEIGQMDLRGVDLVVLSACSSGLGYISSGQGVVGLAGALDRAGARSVACSLWKVDDVATSALMTSFYRHLWGDKPSPGPAAALRAAQRDLIRGASPQEREKPRFAHPRFWAAFFVSGDTSP